MNINRDFEVRFCSILSITSLLLCCISLIMSLEPALILLFTRTLDGYCYIDNYTQLTGSSNCTKPSCSKSCTAPVYNCVRIDVSFIPHFKRYENFNMIQTELMADVGGCGYHLNCGEFYESHNREGSSFRCMYLPNFDIALPKYTNGIISEPSKRLLYSMIPFILFFICTSYTAYRKLLTKGKPVPIKVHQPPPKSFYEMRIREIDERKRLREEKNKMDLYGDDVKVEDLKTVTSLLYKPSFYWKQKLLEEKLAENSNCPEIEQDRPF